MSLNIVKGIYDSFANNDIAGFLAMCSEDIEWVVNGPPELEKCRAFRGIDGVKDFLRILDRDWRFTAFKPREFVVGTDQVVVLGEEEGAYRLTDERFQNRWAHIFTIRQGRIIRFREFLCHWHGGNEPPAMSWNEI